MREYNIDEVFEKLKAYKITTNKESVRRWLREGTIKGYIETKRDGWKVREEDLQSFIDSRMPDLDVTLNTTNVVNEEAIREKMWFDIVRRNIFEGYVDIKKSRLKECIEHNRQSTEFLNYCWEHLERESKGRGYKIPRISYLLDAFLYDGKRMKFDDTYASVEEQVIFTVIEYIRLQKVNKADTTANN